MLTRPLAYGGLALVLITTVFVVAYVWFPRIFVLLLLLACSILVLPIWALVHFGLEYCYLMHAKRYCKKKGYECSRGKYGMALDESGRKTEYYLFDLDCLDAQGQRKLVRLKIWIFGIRKVLRDENYPQPYDEWPDSSKDNQITGHMCASMEEGVFVQLPPPDRGETA